MSDKCNKLLTTVPGGFPCSQVPGTVSRYKHSLFPLPAQKVDGIIAHPSFSYT